MLLQPRWIVRWQNARAAARVTSATGYHTLRYYQVRLVPQDIALVVLQRSEQHQLLLIVTVYLHPIAEHRYSHGRHLFRNYFYPSSLGLSSPGERLPRDSIRMRMRLNDDDDNAWDAPL